MENIQIFKNEEFGQVRTIEIDGEAWFVGKDVAAALGYKDTVNALKTHCDEEDKKNFKGGETPGLKLSNFGATIINESGVYALVFSSKLEGAKRFKHWITSEVLPSIRKHGAYMEDDVIEKALTSPDFLIQLATQLKEEKAKTSKLTVQNEIMRPKAEYFDELVDRNLLTNIRDTAKELGVKQNAFVSFLLSKKYLYRDKQGTLKPFSDRLNQGLFEVKEHINNKTKWSGIQTLITPKGRETFRLLLIEK